jgi:UPF0755 protein
MKFKIIRIPLPWFLIGLAVLFFLATLAPVLHTLFSPFSFSQDGEKAEIKIKYGASTDQIAADLYRHAIITSEKRFKWALFLLQKKNSLRAGHFALLKNSSNYRVIKALTEGPQIYTRVTVPEGLRATAIAAIFQRKLDLDSSKFVDLTRDSTLLRKWAIPAPSLEGYLLPETYLFTWGVTERQAINQLLQQFKKTVWDTLYGRSQEMGFSVQEIITLAAIIQAEAKADSEMAVISSVYHNRLHVGMPLQADPTIQYIIPDGPRRLLLRDLEIHSPYNTYLYPGLPPGPINNPGEKALLAALYPAATDYLYFVANGRGGHFFSRTLAQHLRAKRNLDELRRQLSREKRGQNKS